MIIKQHSYSPNETKETLQDTHSASMEKNSALFHSELWWNSRNLRFSLMSIRIIRHGDVIW